jgi:glucose-1-phosphate thymidylyltransferase
MILGDNIFHGVGLGTHLSTFSESPGATIFGFHVSDPENYGVVELDSSMKIKSLVEKPTSPKSNIAITGLYFFDEQVGNLVASLSPSKRGELEIVDLLDIYLKNDALTLEMLPRGTAWFDTGSVDGLYEASTYVKVVERRTGLSIGDPFQVSESLKIGSD